MERCIFDENFSTQNEAIKKMASFDNGVKKSSKFNWRAFTINSNKEKEEEKLNNVDFDLCFESEDKDGFYFYTIENHNNFFKLIINRTKKHKMITGAIEGDLELLVDNFANTDKMKEFALEKAIANGNWNIVEYITDNCDIKENPIFNCIRYNNVDILRKLIRKGFEIPQSCLAYCMHYDSIDVAKHLLLVEKVHLKFELSELRVLMFNREVQKDKETSKFVRDFFDIPGLDDILGNMRI